MKTSHSLIAANYSVGHGKGVTQARHLCCRAVIHFGKIDRWGAFAGCLFCVFVIGSPEARSSRQQADIYFISAELKRRENVRE